MLIGPVRSFFRGAENWLPYGLIIFSLILCFFGTRISNTRPNVHFFGPKIQIESPKSIREIIPWILGPLQGPPPRNFSMKSPILAIGFAYILQVSRTFRKIPVFQAWTELHLLFFISIYIYIILIYCISCLFIHLFIYLFCLFIC